MKVVLSRNGKEIKDDEEIIIPAGHRFYEVWYGIVKKKIEKGA